MKKKVITVVGARPQFIKAATVSNSLRNVCDEVLVHTGQHYDYNMSEQFFEEMEIPKPDYNLGIAGGSHAQMTARMLVMLEEVMLKENPNLLLVYGDTNSTLAAALAAAKLHFPICHVEAGTRTHSMTNPEEINRICTDHISSLLLTSTEMNLDNLMKENLGKKSYYVGDPMYDAFLRYKEKANGMKHQLSLLNHETMELPSEFYYLTCHREENTSDKEKLLEIMTISKHLKAPVIYPVHPRVKKITFELVEQYKLQNIYLVEPVGYLTSVYMVSHANKVITDSGGLQREAFFAGVPCVTVLDFEVWPETMVGGRNQLAKAKTVDILDKLNVKQQIDLSYMPFGDGNAAQRIIDHIVREVEG